MARGVARRNRLRRLYIKQHGECFFCDQLTWLKSDMNKRTAMKVFGLRDYEVDLFRATFEHVQTRKDKGNESILNGVMSCYQCNFTRGHRPFLDFLLDILSLNRGE